jgi:hypothetical protein
MKNPLGKRLLRPKKYRKHLAFFHDRRGRIWKVVFDGKDLIYRIHYSKKSIRISLKAALHAKLLSDVDTVVEPPRASPLPAPAKS